MKKVFHFLLITGVLFITGFNASAAILPYQVKAILSTGSLNSGSVIWKLENSSLTLIEKFEVEMSDNGVWQGTYDVILFANQWKSYFTGLVVGHTYKWRVRAVDDSDTKYSWVESNSLTIAAFDKLPPVLDLTSGTTNSQINLIFFDKNVAPGNEDTNILEWGEDGVSFPNSRDLGLDFSGPINIGGLKANTTYYFRAFAKKGVTITVPSNIISEKTKRNAPPAPTLSVGGLICPEGLPLNFNVIDPSQINDAYLQVSNDNVVWNNYGGSLNGKTSVGVQTEPGKRQYYRIASVNESGTTYSGILELTAPVYEKPSAPTGLVVVPATNTNSLTINWANANDQNTDCQSKIRTVIYIWASINGGEEKRVGVIDPNHTTFELTGLEPKDKVTFKVQSFNETNKGFGGNFSDFASGQTLGPPSIPSDLSATTFVDKLGDTQTDLFWLSNSDDADGFTIEVSLDGGATYKYLAFVNQQFPNTNLRGMHHKPVQEGVTYTYRVKAYNKWGDSKYSETFSFTPAYSKIPNPPFNLKAKATGTTVDLNWSDDSDREAYFVIERSNDGLTYDSLGKADRNKTTFSDNTAVNGKTYIYRVKAVNTLGSATSNSVSLTIGASGIVDAGDNGIGIFPNPTVDLVNLKVASKYNGTKGDVMIIDQNNRVVMKQSVKFTEENIQIDMKNFKEGSYSIIVITDDFKLSKKVFKY